MCVCARACVCVYVSVCACECVSLCVCVFGGWIGCVCLPAKGVVLHDRTYSIMLIYFIMLTCCMSASRLITTFVDKRLVYRFLQSPPLHTSSSMHVSRDYTYTHAHSRVHTPYTQHAKETDCVENANCFPACVSVCGVCVCKMCACVCNVHV